MWQAFLSLASKQSIIFSYPIRSDEGLTLETSAFQLVTVANLHFQLSWYNQIISLPPPTQHHSFFRNFHLYSIAWIGWVLLGISSLATTADIDTCCKQK